MPPPACTFLALLALLALPALADFAIVANLTNPLISIPMAGGFGNGPPVYFTYSAALDSSSNYLVHIKVVYTGGGYIGVGLGSTGGSSKMIGGVAVMGLGDSGYPAVGLYKLKGTTTSDVILFPGSLASLGIFNASFTASSPNTTLEFYYNQTIGGSNMQLINPANPNVTSMIFATGSDLTFQQHTRRTSYNVDLLASSAVSQTRELDKALAAHVISAIIGFIFLFPLGASIALCHNRNVSGSIWFQWHRGIQITAAFFAIIVIACGYYHVYEMGEAHFSRPHHVLGTFVCIAVFTQIVNGLMRPHIHPGQPPSRVRVQWYVLHRVTAAFVLIGGLANVLLGPELFQDVFLGSAQSYAIEGYTFQASNMEDFVYVASAAALVWVVVFEWYGIFVRPHVTKKPNEPTTAGPVVAQQPGAPGSKV